ncbi:MAG: hypothetical protein GAK35_00230 [Herbaspirillum frisingense]|uniref:Gamma-glutamylcyclotransferase family protein n=1 Tax=Herbaspirillum frisingense TaxID=92645 RepID=A0A7V8G0F7_9BURK|nr:MAG: hypothetical protein GAK35_00230 [Herbaspirillum frisingense]
MASAPITARPERTARLPWVFVYGSLKRGQYNQHVLQGARFAAVARSVLAWRLVALRRYPALVRAPGPSPVTGELWDVPDGMMTMLDRFEEVPDLYARHEIEVECLESDEEGGLAAGARLMAQAYFMPAALAAAGRDLPAGTWPQQD